MLLCISGATEYFCQYYYCGLKYNWEPSKVFILLSKNQSRNDEVEKFLKMKSESETRNRADKKPNKIF